MILMMIRDVGSNPMEPELACSLINEIGKNIESF